MFTQDELKWLYQVLDQLMLRGIPDKVIRLRLMIKLQQALQPPKPEDKSD